MVPCLPFSGNLCCLCLKLAPPSALRPNIVHTGILRQAQTKPQQQLNASTGSLHTFGGIANVKGASQDFYMWCDVSACLPLSGNYTHAAFVQLSTITGNNSQLHINDSAASVDRRQRRPSLSVARGSSQLEASLCCCSTVCPMSRLKTWAPTQVLPSKGFSSRYRRTLKVCIKHTVSFLVGCILRVWNSFFFFFSYIHIYHRYCRNV